MSEALHCPACSKPTSIVGSLRTCAACKLSAPPVVLALLAARQSVAGVEAMDAAVRAVTLVLDQLQRDADTYRVLGFGTEAFPVLCAAEAAIQGRPQRAIEDERVFCHDKGLSSVERLTAELNALREGKP